MFIKIPPRRSTININQSVEGETIEKKIRRITSQNEPITDGAPQIFTGKDDGIDPAFNIRTDRFEIAIEAMDLQHKTTLAKSESSATKNTSDDGGTATQDGNENGGGSEGSEE